MIKTNRMCIEFNKENIQRDFDIYVKAIVDSGLSQSMSEKLIYVGFVGGILLLVVACFQLYFGFKNKDLFI